MSGPFIIPEKKTGMEGTWNQRSHDATWCHTNHTLPAFWLKKGPVLGGFWIWKKKWFLPCWQSRCERNTSKQWDSWKSILILSQLKTSQKGGWSTAIITMLSWNKNLGQILGPDKHNKKRCQSQQFWRKTDERPIFLWQKNSSTPKTVILKIFFAKMMTWIHPSPRSVFFWKKSYYKPLTYFFVEAIRGQNSKRRGSKLPPIASRSFWRGTTRGKRKNAGVLLGRGNVDHRWPLTVEGGLGMPGNGWTGVWFKKFNEAFEDDTWYTYPWNGKIFRTQKEIALIYKWDIMGYVWRAWECFQLFKIILKKMISLVKLAIPDP